LNTVESKKLLRILFAEINHKTDESYTLHVHEKEINDLRSNVLVVNIRADTFFGARHGLETLSQLVVYDAFRNKFVV
jgi:hexosaminidase